VGSPAKRRSKTLFSLQTCEAFAPCQSVPRWKIFTSRSVSWIVLRLLGGTLPLWLISPAFVPCVQSPKNGGFSLPSSGGKGRGWAVVLGEPSGELLGGSAALSSAGEACAPWPWLLPRLFKRYLSRASKNPSAGLPSRREAGPADKRSASVSGPPGSVSAFPAVPLVSNLSNLSKISISLVLV
jgi:hypothetical protein